MLTSMMKASSTANLLRDSSTERVCVPSLYVPQITGTFGLGSITAIGHGASTPGGRTFLFIM